MSTSFLHHAFRLPGYDYVQQEFVGGNILLQVRPKGKLVRCPCYRSSNVVHRGVSERWLRKVPVGFKPAWLVAEIPRIGCASCGLVRRIELRIAEPRRRHTKAFERFILALTKAMTILDFRLLGISWDVVKDILKRHLHRRFAKPKLTGLEYLTIDEISVRKGHKYLTLGMDLRSCRTDDLWSSPKLRSKFFDPVFCEYRHEPEGPFFESFRADCIQRATGKHNSVLQPRERAAATGPSHPCPRTHRECTGDARRTPPLKEAIGRERYKP